MNRKRIVLGVVMAFLLVGASFFYALRYEPAFYVAAQGDRRPPKVRLEEAQFFEQTSLQLYNDIRFEDRWSREITDDMVNSWLAEILPLKFGDAIPPEIGEPRVQFEAGHLLFAFRARTGIWRGVVNCRIRVWTVDSNQLALDLETTRIGLIPIPIDDLIGELIKKLNTQGMHAEWKNSEGRDVLVLSLTPEALGEDGALASLERVELTPGLLRVSGGRGG